MFTPILCLCTLSLAVFVIPVESGERISFSLTCLLSVVLFITLLTSTLPQSADTRPIMCEFLLVQTIFCILACFCNILSLKAYHKDGMAEKPGKCWYSFMSFLRKLGCCKPMIQSEAYIKGSVSFRRNIVVNTNNVDDDYRQTDVNTDIIEVYRKDTSVVIDRICLAVMVVLDIIYYLYFTFQILHACVHIVSD